jgi:hypothetical protein
LCNFENFDSSKTQGASLFKTTTGTGLSVKAKQASLHFRQSKHLPYPAAQNRLAVSMASAEL